MKRNKRWSEMSPRQQTAVLVLASFECSLTAAALVDLVRRPAEQVRGRKIWWGLGFLVQPMGPIAYLAIGRRD